jgi:hypothetical protein
MRHITILVAFAALLTPLGTAAQLTVRPGERVRVTRPPDCGGSRARCIGRPVRIVGTLLALQPDSLVMESDGDTLALPLGIVTGLDVRRGRKANTAKGAGIGFLLGSLAGALIGYASYQECESTGWFSCTLDLGPAASAVGGWILGGLGGVIVGALIGGSTRR